MQNETLGQIIAQAGPLDDAILEIYEMPEASVGWAIRFADIDIRVENRADAGCVAISALIGGPEGAIVPDVYRALLAANALWRENGGLRFAIASAEDHIEISITLPHASVTPETLAGYARTLANHATDWSMLFNGTLTDDLGDDAALAFDPEMIRL